MQAASVVPRQVTQFRITDVGTDRVTLRWGLTADGPMPVGFRIYIDSVSDEFRDVVLADPTATSHVLTGLSRKTSYRLGLGALGADGPVPATVLWTSTTTRATEHAPVGALESVETIPGGAGLRLTGWVADLDTADPITVEFRLDGAVPSFDKALADGVRRDVGAAYPGTGDLHGYTIAVGWSAGNLLPGQHELCIWALDFTESIDAYATQVGCHVLTVHPFEAPKGHLESVAVVGTSVTVRGWALERTGAADVTIETTVDGGDPWSGRTDQARADVGRVYPGTGSTHGFSMRRTIDPGTHTVCVWALVGREGTRTLLGCPVVTTKVIPPVGNFEAVLAPGTMVTLRGWALDPSDVSDARIRYSIDGTRYPVLDYASADTGEVRPDVGRAYPGTGDRHGFEVSFRLTPGVHQLCVFTFAAESADVPLGCRSVTVREAPPVGNLETLTTDWGRLSFYGWAVDPDLDPEHAVHVHIYVNGVWTVDVLTLGERPDVARLYPASRGYQGFAGAVDGLPNGVHEVCGFAIDESTGGNTPLGCRTARIGPPNRLPSGNFESLTAKSTAVTLVGWALDHDTTGPTDVHYYLDGGWGGSITTGVTRPDVAAAYPGTGTTSGFTRTFTASPGTHQVCAYAIDTTTKANTPLGCRTITVSAPVNRLPSGNFESLTAKGTAVTLVGWALDHDTTGPTDVHYYLDGGWGGSITTGVTRPDVAAAYPGTGTTSGFTRTFTASPGTHQVCAYAIDTTTAKANTPLGCRTVTVR